MGLDANDIHIERGADVLRDMLDGAPAWKPKPAQNGVTASPDVAATTPIIEAKPWWRDPANIPPRQFLYGRHYIRRAISATIAGGGRGKTTLSVFEAVTMAAGRDLNNGVPLPDGQPLRVWLLNGEEDQDELDRRVAAVCQRYRVTQSDLGGRLFVQSVRDRPMRVATMGEGGAKIDDNVVNQMIAFIVGNKIDVFMVDPLVSFHGVAENDNSHVDLLVKQGFGAIANKTNSAVEIFHHPGKSKPGQAETVVEDGRGASAFLWAVRSARALNFMTRDEAEDLGLSDDARRLHVRLANGKANMGPLGKAVWMKIEVETLPNGDQVAVPSSWTPPDAFDGVTNADKELAIRLAETGEYRFDSRSPKWFGYAVAEGLHINVSHGGDNSPAALAKLKGILKTWRKNKVFDVKPRLDDHGKPREFVVASRSSQHGPTTRHSGDTEGDIE